MRQEGLGAERLAGGPREAERRGRGPVQGRVVGVAVRPGVALPLRLVALPVAVVRVVLRVPATAENERDTQSTVSSAFPLKGKVELLMF